MAPAAVEARLGHKVQRVPLDQQARQDPKGLTDRKDQRDPKGLLVRKDRLTKVRMIRFPS